MPKMQGMMAQMMRQMLLMQQSMQDMSQRSSQNGSVPDLQSGQTFRSVACPCLGGQGTEPYEQKTQQSPCFGFSRT